MLSSQKAVVNLRLQDPWPMSEILCQLQLVTNQSASTTDVSLRCVNGSIPAHSVVLKVASPFLAKLLTDYTTEKIQSNVIHIVLPDFDVLMVRKVIQTMYTGLAINIKTAAEIEAVKEVLKAFKMDNDPTFSLRKEEEDDDYDFLQILYYEYNAPKVGVEEEPNEHEVYRLIQEVRYVDVNTDNADDNTSVENFGIGERAIINGIDDTSDPSTDDVEIQVISTPQVEKKKKAPAILVDLSESHDSEQEEDPEPSPPALESPEPKTASSNNSKSEKSKAAFQQGAKRSDSLPSTSVMTTAGRRSLRTRVQLRKSLEEKDDSSSGSDKYKKPPSSSSEQSSDDDVALALTKVRKRRSLSARTARSRRGPPPKILLPTAKNLAAQRKQAGSANSSTIKSPISPKNSSSSKLGEDMEIGDNSDGDGGGSISSIDCDNDDSDYANRKHAEFMEAAKKCGKCGTKFEDAKGASVCVTEKHKNVRCYYCFKVLLNTEKLFEHYRDAHRKAGKEGHLLCKFCQQVVSFKSVSTHVISNHLFDKNKKTSPGMPVGGAGNRRVGPGRPPSIGNASFTATNTSANSNAAAAAANKRKPAEESSEYDSDSDDDKVLAGGRSMVIKKKTSTGKKVYKMGRI